MQSCQRKARFHAIRDLSTVRNDVLGQRYVVRHQAALLFAHTGNSCEDDPANVEDMDTSPSVHKPGAVGVAGRCCLNLWEARRYRTPALFTQ